MESNGAIPTGILQLPKQLFWDAGGKKKKKVAKKKWHAEQWIWIHLQRSEILVIKNSMSTCLKFHQREFRPLHVLSIDGKLKGLSENHNIKL